jgi:toxin ParE1/3/4
VTHTVELSDLFKEDLADIWLFLARRNSDAAAHRTTSTILKELEVLEDFPLIGRSRDDLREGIRALLCTKHYIVFYRVIESRVIVLRVVHGARDLERLFEPVS